jgi:hypothetical protein
MASCKVCTAGSIIAVIVTEDDTDETCGAHRKLLKSVEDFVGNLKERARFVDLGAGGTPSPSKKFNGS